MFNITEFERKHGVRFVKSGNGFEYEGNLILYNKDVEHLPDNLVTEYCLDIGDNHIESLPDNLTVGGFLDIRGTGITSLPDNLTVGGYLNLEGTGVTSLPDNLTVGGYLNLEGTGVTSLPDNLTVGGSLYIRGTGITSLPDNLTVGGSLDLEGTGITSLPDNLTVGGFLYLRGTSIADTSKVNREVVDFFEWRDRTYVKVDGIFSKVVSHNGNAYKVRKIGSSEITYLVTDGNGKWAHGYTLEDAKRNLIYKISNVDKSKYENYTLDTEVTLEEGIEMYRVITGACLFGVKDFVENKLKILKGKYKVSEIISITKEEYGNKKLCDYFNNKKTNKKKWKN